MPDPLTYIAQDWLVLGAMPQTVSWGEHDDRVLRMPVRPLLEVIASPEAFTVQWARLPDHLIDMVEQITGQRTGSYPEAATALLDSSER